jgi:hypothetical protein
VENLKRIMASLQEWTFQEGEDYAQLAELYGQVAGQWSRYVGHVMANIGGVDWTRRAQGQAERPYSVIDRERQARAMDYLDRQVFTTPEWMIDPDIIFRIRNEGTPDQIRGLQVGALNNLLQVARMKRLIEQEALLDDEAYALGDMLADLRASVWRELSTGAAIDPYRRNLQRAYLERMKFLMEDEEAMQTDVAPHARGQLRTLEGEIERARGADEASRLHLADALARIEAILDG